MTARKPLLALGRYRDAQGRPLQGWTLASRTRRLLAWTIDLALIVATLGTSLILSVALWEEGTTPGKHLLRLTVFATDTGRPADRHRMALRALVHRMWARAFGVATLGLGWVYAIAGAAGETRRTLYDDWAQTVVLAAPRG